MRSRPANKMFVSCMGSLVLLLHLTCGPFSYAAQTAREEIIFRLSGVSVLAEIADSPEKKSRGLMYRTSLGPKEAMIFIYDEPAYHSFWMYNTRIPLTIVFVDKDFTIVDIQDMSPCTEKEPSLCPTYTPKKPAQYAIEVNRGFTAGHGIRVGDRITVVRDKQERARKR